MKNKIKKSLSLIMAVLMVLSCWVWVAPTKAEAAGTNYYVEVVWNANSTEQSGAPKFDGDDDGSSNGFKIEYVTNNGTGDTKSVVYDCVGKSEKTDVTASFTLSGFPTKIYVELDGGSIFASDQLDIKSIKIGTDSKNLTTVFNGVITMKSSTKCKNFTLDYTGATTSNDTDNAYMNGNTAEWKLPKPSTISGLGGVTNITIPDINTPENADPLSYTYTAKVLDQYGVEWYQTPNYNLSQSSGGTQDMSDQESGFWWTPSADLTKATVKVNANMQTVYSLKSGTERDFYLVASLSEADGYAVGAQTLHVTYPTYDWYFDANVKRDGKTVGQPIIMMEDKSTDETRTYLWDGDSNGTPDAIIDAPNYLAYNQASAILPMYAEMDGFVFYGFWTKPQPDATGAKGQAFSKESSFAEPISSDNYFNLPEDEKELYSDAGEQWNYKTGSVTTNDKKYYGWWLAKDITVKFYDIDGSYIDTFEVKGGETNSAITWPKPAVENGGITNGAFSFGDWTGNWENIDGTVVNPGAYTFTKNLILTPLYKDASFDRIHRVTFYNSNGNAIAANTKDYNYRDVAVVPANSAVNAINTYATDYSYEFVGWSADAPSTDKTYHVILEDADYDLKGNAVYLAEDFIVRAETTYYPVFRRQAKPFDVIFVYADATGDYVEKTVEYKYGQKIVIPEEVPAFYAAFGFEYTIIGWQKNGADITLGEEVCTGMNVYVAKYDNGVQKPYNVTFEYRDADGELVTKVAEVYEGEEVGQTFVNALKPNATYDDDVQELYFNNKWLCSGNGNTYTTAQLATYAPANHVTFTAVYENGVPFRTVTYVDGVITESFRKTSGTTLPYWEKEIISGETVTKEEYIPTKAATEYGKYEFAGWFDAQQTSETATNGTQYIPGTTPITEDVTLYPQFIYRPYKYNFVFNNEDGLLLTEAALNYGDSLADLQAAAEALAVKAADEKYTYVFLGWDKKVPEKCEGGEPDSTMVFTAQYKPVYVYYNVEWFNDIDAYTAGTNPLATSKYVYGDKIHTPSVQLTLPTGAPAGQNYVFAGWAYLDANGEEQAFSRNMTVESGMKFYATYALTAKTWKVTVNDGTNTYTLTVKDGETLADLISDPIAGYKDAEKHNAFAGWTSNDAKFELTTEIKADTEIVASFTEGAHVYDKSEVVTYPSYPMAGYTDYNGAVIDATTGEGLQGFWCECNKDKTFTTTIEGCVIPALTDKVVPGATTYIGEANWSSFEAGAAAGKVYANPNTDFIITTSDKGDVNDPFNLSGTGIGIQKIAMLVVSADANYPEDELAKGFEELGGKVVYDWATIQNLLIQNYGGWAKVPEMYKNYNANYTVKLGSLGLEDGKDYVVYAKVVDKAGNASYVRTAAFVYDATKPAATVTGNYNANDNTYCEQAVIEVTEATDYTITVDGTPINHATVNNKYNIVTPGAHQVVITDKAGNKTTIFFTVLASHDLAAYNQAPTCVVAGFTSERCLNCGADFNKTDVAELGHDWKDVIVDATCEEHGYIERSCTRCENTPEREYYNKNADGSIVKDEEGNDVLLYPASGHTYGEGEVVKAATCQATGVKNFKCSVCGHSKQETIAKDATAHVYYKPQVVKATCTEGGYTKLVCKYGCPEIITDKTAPAGHTFDAWIIKDAVRCYPYGQDASGNDYYGTEQNICSVCKANNDDVVRYIYEGTAHVWAVDERREPAVGVPGEITYKCSVDGCKNTKEPTIIDALVDYTITFIGTTTKVVTDDEGKTTTVEEATETKVTDLPGVTVDGATIPEQKKLNSADGKVAYVFDGWYTADGKKYTLPLEISKDLTLYAKFREKNIFYTVDFEVPAAYVPAAGEVKESYTGYKKVKSLMGAIGDTRVPGEIPTLAETNYYSFTFDGWYTKGTNPKKYDGKVAGDGTYQAVFTAEAKAYKVIFINEGIVYATVNVTAGETATVTGTPAKASDANNHYTFKGWYTSADGRTAADLTDITKDMTVYAVYDDAEHIKNDGEVTQVANCTLPEITKYTCTECSYEWTEVTAESDGHTPGKAEYNEETGKNEVYCTVCNELLTSVDAAYTVKFENYDGQRLGTLKVNVNKTFNELVIDIEKLAIRKTDDQYDYTFDGWIVNKGDAPVATKDLPAATADITYVAHYTAAARKFTVTYATSVLATPEGTKTIQSFAGIVYGTKLDEEGNDVTAFEFDAAVFGIPMSTAKVHYVFAGWDTDLSAGVTKDTVVRPKYDAIAHDFDKNNDGVVDTKDGVSTAATCTTSGGYKYTCEDCGYSYVSGNINALGHNYVSKVTVEPTFTATGELTKTCQRCGDVVTEVLAKKEYITVKVSVKDEDGKAYSGAKVELTSDATGKVYGTILTDTNGVATFLVEESGKYFVRVLEIPGHAGGLSGYITVNDKGDITSNTVPLLEGDHTGDCSCACHKENFWGIIFRLFHKFIKLFAGRYVCCDDPSNY